MLIEQRPKDLSLVLKAHMAGPLSLTFVFDAQLNEALWQGNVRRTEDGREWDTPNDCMVMTREETEENRAT